MNFESENFLQNEGLEKPEINGFEKTGGKIIEYYESGRPKRWLCGKGNNDEIIDPLKIKPENILHRLNKDGLWEGVNPTEENIKEIKKWRTDWMDV